MRMRLTELAPEWILNPATTGRLGLSFICPAHNGGGHRISVIFAYPPDGDDALTVPPGVTRRSYPHEGDTFETLTLIPPIVDGEELIFLYRGEVNVG